MTIKRIYIATLMGILAGVICCLLSNSGEPLPLKVLANIFAGRVLIGFVIGISGLRMIWGLHGILMGLIVSIPTAIGAMMGANALFGKWELFFLSIIMGAVYGFMIELVTSGLFKAKMQ